MSKVVISAALTAASIAYTGCSSGGESGGGGGNGGPSTAFSFDAETAEEAGGAAAVATELATRVGTTVSTVFSALASGVEAASLGVGPKDIVPIPPICAEGAATLDWQRAGTNTDLSAGDTVVLTLDNCSGSPVSTMPANGTITLAITEVGGGLPVIGGIISATVTLDLSIAPDTTITGNFALDANLPSLALANLFFGTRQGSDLITVTEGFFQMQLACFDIYQRVFLTNPGIEFFRPLGVLKVSNQVFTMNSYEEAPPNIQFDFAGFDATPRSGSLTLTSGDRSTLSEPGDPDSAPACASFSGNPTPNESFVTATFTGGGCVTLDGTDAEGTPFTLVRTWDSLLEVGTPGGPGDSCGTGGTGGGSTTVATPGPTDCNPSADQDLETIADAYIRGGPNSDMALGAASNLVIKSVSDQNFTRKIYLAFDISSRQPFNPDNPSFDKAYLVLTLQRHVENEDPSKSGPQPVNVYGIDDDNDWDPDPQGDLPEGAITWNNAPRNVTALPPQRQFEDSPGVPLLVPAYDFDLPPVGEIDPGALSDPPVVTRYALDVTDYVKERLENDLDDKITILMAADNPMSLNQDGSAFFSLQASVECDRPFLHFE